MAGVSQAQAGVAFSAGVGGRPNRRRLSAGDGRRGVQPLNAFSRECGVFMIESLHRFLEFAHAVAITARGGVGGEFQQAPNRFECVLVPDFQHDDLGLFAGEACQADHGRPFPRVG